MWRTRTLPWVVGAFCAVVGSLILVAPDRIGSPSYANAQSSLAGWGLLFLLAGGGLLAAATLAIPRWLTVAAHLVAGLALVAMAPGLATGGGLRGVVVYSALGLGTLLAPLLPRRAPEKAARPDWLALVVAATSLVLGALFLARPDLTLPPGLAPPAAPLALAAAFLASGAALLVVQVRPVPPAVARAGHLAAGLAYGAFALLVSRPSGTWSGLVYYGGLGTAVALLPWLAPRLPRPETTGLRARFALTLIALACVPLVLAEAVTANRAESITLAQVSTDLQVRAGAQSQGLDELARLHLAAVATVASRVDWAGLPPAQQRALLQSLVASDVSAFATFDSTGRPLARSDDLPLAPLDPGLLDALRRGGPAMLVAESRPARPSIIVFGAPWAARAGPPGGFVTAEVGVSALDAALAQFDPEARTGSAVFLVDATGRLIARAGPPGAPAGPPGPTVAAVLAGDGSGTLRYPTDQGDQLAAFARVPATGWGIVVERPVAVVLASSRAERDLTFGFLLVACLAAVGIGVLAAERLVAPLRALAGAVDRLADDDATAPLPRSSIAEVARLTTGFGRARAQLAARAAEREAVLAREQDAHARAEAAVRLRDDFLSIAAHELKTPITGLRMGVQALLRYSDRGVPADSPQLRAALQTIDGQSTRLTRMVVQLLEVSRFQLGRFALQRGPENLTDLVAGVVGQIQAQTARHALVLSAPPEAWAVVDGLRVEQVVANLLDNAVKYSPNGGRIDVTLAQDTPDQVRLSVRDRGIGIPPERRSRIFDLFYQAHVDSHRSGMGIGLYLVRQIVELHGGRVDVAFPPDGGTCFAVALPTGAESEVRSQESGVRRGPIPLLTPDS